ncbi:YHS domain-containing protein [Afifella pfennigii]|uniref:YHS domain-containing protein n=1 Tax=Afifella pfennigii TaxID=209897 RepID=UPI00068F0903|nr:YHS domain-containing protein [Afifella pfennigii]
MLLYIALWGGLIFLMLRFCGAHLIGRRERGESTDEAEIGASPVPTHWSPAGYERDPVCGRSFRKRTAKTSVFDGRVYHFCSRDCREVFEAAPDLYPDDEPRAPVPETELPMPGAPAARHVLARTVTSSKEGVSR